MSLDYTNNREKVHIIPTEGESYSAWFADYNQDKILIENKNFGDQPTCEKLTISEYDDPDLIPLRDLLDSMTSRKDTTYEGVIQEEWQDSPHHKFVNMQLGFAALYFDAYTDLPAWIAVESSYFYKVLAHFEAHFTTSELMPPTCRW